MARELEFERPLRELERQIYELRRRAGSQPPQQNGVKLRSGAQIDRQLAQLEGRAEKLTKKIFSGLTRWETVQVARHPERPYPLDYLERVFDGFIELHGDRSFSDDAAIVGGLAKLGGRAVMVIGHQKGRTTQENMRRNFGMPKPEGYRKAMRLMQMAERFSLPIITLIDTPGAYPGIGAEERGQSQAIAEALECMAHLAVPIVAAVIGEGGSGGALAIGVANRIIMLEYSCYSVISPEGCASILFKDAAYAEGAADALRLTAPDLFALGVIDEIVGEPLGGAHRNPDAAAESLEAALISHLTELSKMSAKKLRDDRYHRFRLLGEMAEMKKRSKTRSGAKKKAPATKRAAKKRSTSKRAPTKRPAAKRTAAAKAASRKKKVAAKKVTAKKKASPKRRKVQKAAKKTASKKRRTRAK